MTRAATLILLAVALTGCPTDDTVVINQAPRVTLVEPVDGATLTRGVPVTFRATIADDMDGADALVALWRSDVDGVLGTDPPYDGAEEGEPVVTASLNTGQLAVGPHLVTLAVADSAGLTGSTTVALEVVVDQPPQQVQVFSPLGEAVQAGDEVSFSGFAADPDGEVTALDVAWYSDRDGTLDNSPPDADGALGFGTTTLSLGTHQVTLVVSDGLGQAAVVTTSVTVEQGESCNGRDDDGDGLVDEGFDSDGDGIPDCADPEECDGLDNDGDGLIDEGFEDADGDGVMDCQDFEECDGLDNDGNGETDEGYQDTDGDGLKDCMEVETCDGVDNTGEGQIDEGC